MVPHPIIISKVPESLQQQPSQTSDGFKYLIIMLINHAHAVKRSTKLISQHGIDIDADQNDRPGDIVTDITQLNVGPIDDRQFPAVIQNVVQIIIAVNT